MNSFLKKIKSEVPQEAPLQEPQEAPIKEKHPNFKRFNVKPMKHGGGYSVREGKDIIKVFWGEEAKEEAKIFIEEYVEPEVDSRAGSTEKQEEQELDVEAEKKRRDKKQQKKQKKNFKRFIVTKNNYVDGYSVRKKKDYSIVKIFWGEYAEEQASFFIKNYDKKKDGPAKQLETKEALEEVYWERENRKEAN